MKNGYSICIGLNHVNPNHYDGWDGQLNSPEKDASDMQKLTKSLGYSTELMLGKNATRVNVTRALENATKSLDKNDILMVFYSGHGGKLPDIDRDEENDTNDETWCLYDQEMLDDEIKLFWPEFKDGVRVFVLSDSCNSGTIIKNQRHAATHVTDPGEQLSIKSMPLPVAQRTYYENESGYKRYINEVDKQMASQRKNKSKINASIRLISGCQDNTSSYDGLLNSKFTEKLLKVWNGGQFKGNYEKFHSEIYRLLQPVQCPNHLLTGKANPVYNAQIPFTI